VPVVPMAYSRKFAGLFGSLGYKRTVDCRSESAETILDKIARAWEDRAILAEEAQAGLTEGLRRLECYETALRLVLGR